jgi:hypothetical protein
MRIAGLALLAVLLALSVAWAASVSAPLTLSVTVSSPQTILPAPPSGQQWVQTFGDEFSSAFNTSVWDIDHFGGSPNANAATNNGILTINIDTNVPDTRTIIDTWTTSGGTGNHAFSQRYGYFVYNIKLPTCSSGEYDVEFFGRDNWTGGGLPVGKYAEMAIASGKSECNYRNLRPYQADGNAGFSFMSDPDVGADVTLGFHQYGLLWVNDGSAHGSVTMYFDGVPFSGPVQLLSAGWDVGLFFDLYWSPEQAGNTLGGSNGVPIPPGTVMQVDWVRAYQLAPSGAPPAPPAQASVANFNTCVVCIDFTAPTGGVFVNGSAPPGVNAAQPNTWLDCAGASTPIFYHGVNVGAVSGPCPTVSADPSAIKALKIQLGTNSIPASTDFFNGIQSGGGYPPPSTAIQVPTNSYTESTLWVSSWPLNGDNSHPVYSQGHWEGEFDGSPQGPSTAYNWFEFDANELCCDLGAGGAWASAWGTWSGSHINGSSNWFGSFPPHAATSGNYRVDQGYVKIGMRITSDGANNIVKCMWINNVFQNCVSWVAGSSGGEYFTWQLSDTSSRMRFLYSPVGVYNGSNSNGQTLPSDMISWTKSINIWSCSSWKITACSTPGNPDPGGY